jgi:putative hydrolase of the HAD superfamily
VTLSAVIFDWGGTLTPWHRIEPREAWLAATGDAETARRLAAAEQEVWIRSLDEHRSGTLTEVFETAGVTHTEQVSTAFSRWWEPHTYLDPDAPALFDALHDRGLKVGVLSNTIWSRAEHERIFERDGVLDRIDGAVYSSEIEWTKPHPEAFRAAMAAVGVDDPGAALFVGDTATSPIRRRGRSRVRPTPSCIAWPTCSPSSTRCAERPPQRPGKGTVTCVGVASARHRAARTALLIRAVCALTRTLRASGPDVPGVAAARRYRNRHAVAQWSSSSTAVRRADAVSPTGYRAG